MKLNLALEYTYPDFERVANPAKPTELVPMRQITVNFISQAVASKHPQGIADRDVARLWARVQRALNKAVIAKVDEADLSIDGLEFVKNSLDAWSVPTGAAHAREDIFDAVSAALTAAKAAANEVKTAPAALPTS